METKKYTNRKQKSHPFSSFFFSLFPTTFIIAWRNIWRNKLRSLVVILAITIGVFGGLAGAGIMKGMVLDMLNNVLENQISDIQIHNSKFLENNEVGFIIKNTSQLLNNIKKNKDVVAVCQRTKTFGMAATASTGTGVMINGIEPNIEQKVTKIYEKLTDSLSHYFVSDKNNRIVISKKIAKKLNVKVKSKIIFTFQDFEGNLTGATFKVEGIYKTQNSVFDEQNVFVRKADLDRLLNMPKNSSHEIAILTNDYKNIDLVISDINPNIKDYDVEAWYDIDPYIQMTTSMVDYMLYIFMIIILLALGFAIVNTMLMAILERTKELGMIMAIGMNKRKIFVMIMYETTLLTFVGGIVGILITIIFTTYFGKVGIDISSVGEGFEALGYGSVMHPVLELSDYIQVVVLVLLTGIISSIFPTIRAIKMKPAEAVRE